MRRRRAGWHRRRPARGAPPRASASAAGSEIASGASSTTSAGSICAEGRLDVSRRPKEWSNGAATAPMRQQARVSTAAARLLGTCQATASPRPDAALAQPAGHGGHQRVDLGRGEPRVTVDHLAAVGRQQRVERRHVPGAAGPPVGAGQARHPGGSQAGRHGRAPYPHPTNVTPMSGSETGPRVDLSLRREDEEFAASFRDWLAEHPHRPPAFVDLADEVAWGREWQATLAADRWVGVHWPSCVRRAQRDAGAGRAVPERVRPLAGAPAGEPRRASTWWGRHCWPTAPRTSACATCRAILSAEEIWCQLFSEPDAGSDLASLSTRADAGRRGLRRDRPQGLDVVRPVRHVGSVPGPHRAGRTTPAAGHHRADRRHVRRRVSTCARWCR